MKPLFTEEAGDSLSSDFSDNPQQNSLNPTSADTQHPSQTQPRTTNPPRPRQQPTAEEKLEHIRNFFGLGKWVYKMTNVESSNNDSAIGPVTRSGAHAVGRWQVMPDTFRRLNEQYNRESETNEKWNIKDPAQNGFAAMYLLSNNMKRFKRFADNDRHLISLAIAGYHGNADALENWLAADPNNRFKVAPRGFHDGHISTRGHVYKVMQDVDDGDIYPNGRPASLPEAGTGESNDSLASVQQDASTQTIQTQPVEAQTAPATKRDAYSDLYEKGDAQTREIIDRQRRLEANSTPPPAHTPVGEMSFKPYESEGIKGVAENVAALSDNTSIGRAANVQLDIPHPDEAGEKITYRLPMVNNSRPSNTDMALAVAQQLGPQAVDAVRRYKAETGRDLLVFQNNTPPPIISDGASSYYRFEVRPTRGIVDLINAYNKGGLEGAKEEAKRQNEVRARYNAYQTKENAAQEEFRKNRGFFNKVVDTGGGMVQDAALGYLNLANNVSTLAQAAYIGLRHGYDSPEYQELGLDEQATREAIQFSQHLMEEEKKQQGAAERIIRGTGGGLLQVPKYAAAGPHGAGAVAFVDSLGNGSLQDSVKEGVKMNVMNAIGHYFGGAYTNPVARQVAARGANAVMNVGVGLMEGERDLGRLAEEAGIGLGFGPGKRSEAYEVPRSGMKDLFRSRDGFGNDVFFTANHDGGIYRVEATDLPPEQLASARSIAPEEFVHAINNGFKTDEGTSYHPTPQSQDLNRGVNSLLPSPQERLASKSGKAEEVSQQTNQPEAVSQPSQALRKTSEMTDEELVSEGLSLGRDEGLKLVGIDEVDGGVVYSFHNDKGESVKREVKDADRASQARPSPESKAEGAEVQDTLRPDASTSQTTSKDSTAIRAAIEEGIRRKANLDADEFDSTGMTLPEGYIRRGDVYVYEARPEGGEASKTTPDNLESVTVPQTETKPVESAQPEAETQPEDTSTQEADRTYEAASRIADNLGGVIGPNNLIRSLNVTETEANSLMDRLVAEGRVTKDLRPKGQKPKVEPEAEASTTPVTDNSSDVPSPSSGAKDNSSEVTLYDGEAAKVETTDKGTKVIVHRVGDSKNPTARYPVANMEEAQQQIRRASDNRKAGARPSSENATPQPSQTESQTEPNTVPFSSGGKAVKDEDGNWYYSRPGHQDERLPVTDRSQIERLEASLAERQQPQTKATPAVPLTGGGETNTVKNEARNRPVMVSRRGEAVQTEKPTSEAKPASEAASIEAKSGTTPFSQKAESPSRFIEDPRYAETVGTNGKPIAPSQRFIESKGRVYEVGSLLTSGNVSVKFKDGSTKLFKKGEFEYVSPDSPKLKGIIPETPRNPTDFFGKRGMKVPASHVMSDGTLVLNPRAASAIKKLNDNPSHGISLTPGSVKPLIAELKKAGYHDLSNGLAEAFARRGGEGVPVVVVDGKTGWGHFDRTYAEENAHVKTFSLTGNRLDRLVSPEARANIESSEPFKRVVEAIGPDSPRYKARESDVLLAEILGKGIAHDVDGLFGKKATPEEAQSFNDVFQHLLKEVEATHGKDKVDELRRYAAQDNTTVFSDAGASPAPHSEPDGRDELRDIELGLSLHSLKSSEEFERQRELNGRYDYDTFYEQAVKATKGSLTGDEHQRLEQLLREGREAEDEAEAAKVDEKLAKYLMEVGKTSVADLFINFMRANLLLSKNVVGRNIAGNLFKALHQEVTRIPAPFIDAALTRYSNETGRVRGMPIRGVGHGIKKAVTTGFAEAWDTVRNGPMHDSVDGLRTREIHTNWRVFRPFEVYVNAVFRFQAAQDAPFLEYARGRALHEIVRLTYAKNKKAYEAAGITKADLMNEPEGWMADMANTYALDSTFNRRNSFNDFIDKVKDKGGPMVKYPVDFAMPFKRMASNIVADIFDGVGLRQAFQLSSSVRTGKLAEFRANRRDGDSLTTAFKKMSESLSPHEKAMIVDGVSRGLVGWSVMTTGYLLSQKGQLQPYQFLSPAEQQEEELRGAGQGKIRLGHSWYDLRNIGPFTSLLLIGAQAAHNESKPDSKLTPAEKKQKMLDLVIDVLSEHPAGRIVSTRLEDLASPRRVMPSVVGEIAEAQDSGTVRRPGGFTLAQRVTQQMEAMLPKTPLNPEFNRQSLPAKTDSFGDEMKQGYLSPFKVTEDRSDDPVISALRRTDAAFSKSPREKFERNEDYARRLKAEGDTVREAINLALQQPGFPKTDDNLKGQKAIIEHSIDDGRRPEASKLKPKAKAHNAEVNVAYGLTVADMENLSEFKRLGRTKAERKELQERVRQRVSALFNSMKATKSRSLADAQERRDDLDAEGRVPSSAKGRRRLLLDIIEEAKEAKLNSEDN